MQELDSLATPLASVIDEPDYNHMLYNQNSVKKAYPINTDKILRTV
jgi:hypothetical protein